MKVKIPPIKIQGIKTKIVPQILEEVKKINHQFWVEPFMGSGVVGFNIMPTHAIFADTNPYIINFYNDIKNRKIGSRIVEDFLFNEGGKLSKYGIDYYYEVRDRFNKHHESLDFLFLNRCCFNGMIRFNKKGNFNVPFGHKPQRFARAYVTKIKNQIANLENNMLFYSWEFKCQSFEKTISEAPDNSLIYCDPPYIGRHTDYYDSWDENDELLLNNVLTNNRNRYIISTWIETKFRKNTFIDKLWKECKCITKEHFYHLGAKEENRHSVMEGLLIS